MVKNWIKIVFWLCFCIAHTQAQNIHQNIYWTRLYVRVKLDSLYSWQIEADNRRFFGENKQLQFIAHTHLHRKLGKNKEGSLGFTYSEVWQKALPVPEFRPFQEFYIFQTLNSRFRLTHRIRTEQRWFRNFAKNAYGIETLTSGYNFKFRFRYMPRLDYTVSEKWIIKLNDELMYHNDGFDQNRIYVGIEHRFSKKMSFEVGYMKLIQKRNGVDGYFDRNNLRMTFYKDFALK